MIQSAKTVEVPQLQCFEKVVDCSQVQFIDKVVDVQLLLIDGSSSWFHDGA